MRGLPSLVAFAFLTALLAGCAQQGPGGSDSSSIDPNVDVKPTETTGIIKGVVVDLAIKPIAQAVVTVKSAGKTFSNTTNANGGFGFEGLEPGTYFVSASRIGFKTSQTSVEVVANQADVPTTRITLEAQPGFVKPYAVPDKHTGYIECGIGTPVVLVALCAAPNIVAPLTNDDFSHFITLDAGVPMWITGEMVWESTQTVSDRLRVAVRTSTFEDWSSGSYHEGVNSSTGQSPLRYTASTEDILDTNLGNDSIGLELDVFTPNGICDPVAGTCVAGVTLQQKFELITHIFYGFRPSADYRYTVDGPPKPPQ